MGIVRLEFDLDSDVYPELHEALSGLRSDQSRNERLRQLATMGLVWENVRIHGANAIGPTPKASGQPATVQGQPKPPVPAQPASQPTPPPRPRPLTQSPQPAPSPVAVTVAVVPAAPPAKPVRAVKGKRKGAEPAADEALVSPDFVDLAISAKPKPVIQESPDPRIDPSDVEQVARELPVLVDIVNESEEGEGDNEADGVEDEPEAETEGASSSLYASTAQQAPREEMALAASDDDAIHLTALAQKPAMRSRLMRMKERGLFKNG